MRRPGSETARRSVDALDRLDAIVAVGAFHGIASAVILGWAHFSCPFRYLTGCLCPFCGGTTAIVSLADVRVLDAMSSNVVVVAVVFFVALRLSICLLGRESARKHLERAASCLTPGACGLLLFIWTVVRNLPGLQMLGPPG